MLIKDKALGKYLINASPNSYDVGTMRTDKEGVECFNAETFHTTMETAVKRVIKNLVNDTEETLTLEEFLERYQEVSNKVNNALNILS